MHDRHRGHDDDRQQQERLAISALKRGEIAGLELLVRLYQLPAVRAAYAIAGDRQTAEDVVADAFLSVYDHIGQFDEQRPFAPWFYRIVVNGALKAARRTSRSVSWHGSDNAASAEDVWELDQLNTALHTDATSRNVGSNPEEEAIAREMRLLVSSAIYALPSHQRAALVLRYYLDMEEAEIARTLGCPVGTVKWRLYAARKRLRRTLASLAPQPSSAGYQNNQDNQDDQGAQDSQAHECGKPQPAATLSHTHEEQQDGLE